MGGTKPAIRSFTILMAGLHRSETKAIETEQNKNNLTRHRGYAIHLSNEFGYRIGESWCFLNRIDCQTSCEKDVIKNARVLSDRS